ncbi:MAG: pyridoxal-phosphate dependent enzyme [Deinococcales bacterium]
MLDLARIEAARETIAGHVRRTPLQRSDSLSQELGCEVWLKLELFQKTGSFKPRGAFAQLQTVLPEARERGVVAVSGGNFAQGAAYAARELGVRCRVLMPEATPANYLDATRGYGAEVELTAGIPASFERYQRYEQEGWAGVATALNGRLPGIRMWGVETEGADVMTRSLEAGRPLSIEPTSLAHTLGAPTTCDLALDVVRRLAQEVVVVSDADAYQGVLWLLERAKVSAELAAGCTLAAARRLRRSGRVGDDARMVLVICGGNVGLPTLCEYRERFDGG